eukprot:1588464-Rhodomonas_salina.3
MTSFVRVKRKKQTIFLMCKFSSQKAFVVRPARQLTNCTGEQSDTIMSLKKKIQSINSIEV